MSERLISHGVLVFWLVARLLLRGSKCFYVVAKVFWVVARWSLKGGVSDFWSPMLTFEITKTNTPLPQKGLAPILIAPPHTSVQQRLVLWNKAKPVLLTYREEQSNLGVRSQTFPLLEFSPALESWSIFTRVLLLALSYTGCERSGATKYYRTHYNQWCCLLLMPRRDTTNPWQ